ncbi:MAG: hypothetical protein LUG12_13230 [Erysipelotrichaceae bacterium]|nr:hypothetical protein [Erysipelotrichaceae bacterium]
MIRDKQIILDMKQKLAGKFASINHAGVVDAVNFLDISNEEDEMQIRRDVFEKINALINFI